MNRRVVRVGTRKSPLALRQSRWVMDRLAAAWPELACVEVPMVTEGDRVLDQPLDQAGGRGLFVAEMEEALLRGDIDLAVHSMKDLPIDLATGLTLGPVPLRADPRDVLVSREGWTLEELPYGARVGTGSPRRRAQLLAHRPDLQVVALRGNLETRLRKLEEGQAEALVLAAAGLDRMGYGAERVPLEPPAFLPAVGQGALGLELRAGDAWLLDRLAALRDPAAEAATRAERAFLHALGGGCHLPIAAWSEVRGDRLHLLGRVVRTDGARRLEGEEEGSADAAEDVGRRLGEGLLASGARALL
ncbi:hydroxymethylbilane synthase [Limnochorda pilosa]|uniref:Porphobilinogen deaminase n=1 Tax=Limnochorda pilosa TaxID=1555112 RepID=A0A0K2SJB8_LIMPI|nr:hydroxymethylbilane synthase [Limnochorda pilosa]BAS27127.1 porphobilinogen deaminase [Limnochorda pilosa]